MKAQKKGFTLVELLVVIAILGVLMSVFVPKIADALTATNTAAMVNKGKQIVNAIITESMSSDPVWPLAKALEGADSSVPEIYKTPYSTSTKYFEALFDIKKQISPDHKPYISKDLIPNLWGEGVREAQPGNLTDQNVAWTILAGADDLNTDSIPVLISRNVDSQQLATSNRDMSKETNKLNFNTKWPKPFGDKACVVVLKGGSAFSLENNKCTLKDMYKQSPYVAIPDGVELKYLEP